MDGRLQEKEPEIEIETATETTTETTTETAEVPRNRNPVLHVFGVGYSKVRKVFVKIDQCVQRAAGKG